MLGSRFKARSRLAAQSSFLHRWAMRGLLAAIAYPDPSAGVRGRTGGGAVLLAEVSAEGFEEAPGAFFAVGAVCPELVEEDTVFGMRESSALRDLLELE